MTTPKTIYFSFAITEQTQCSTHRGKYAKVRTQSKGGKIGPDHLENRVGKTSLPDCPTLLSATGGGGVAEAGLPAPAGDLNTPGNVAGPLPPGTAGSRRLPQWTREDPCKRAEESPAGQKLGIERIRENKPM